MFNGQVPITTIHEISDIEGYKINDMFSNMNLTPSTLDNSQELTDEKKKLFPTFESDNIPVKISKRLQSSIFYFNIKINLIRMTVLLLRPPTSSNVK